jgi:hypothetical protein
MAGPQLGVGNSQYTPLSTAGTTTLNQGQVGPRALSNGVLYGASCVLFGTAPVLQVLDIIQPSNIGTNTTTVTNTLLNGTFTAAGQTFTAGIAGVGVRYQGALVAVYAGVASAVNALWD